MNQLLEQFHSHFKNYYKLKENAQQYILEELRNYANENPQQFIVDLKEFWFDWKIMPLDFVIQALAKDGAQWEPFFIELLETLIAEAKKSDKPKPYLSLLGGFAYVELENKQFGQKVVDRLKPELDSENLAIKLAAIENLTYYSRNPLIAGKDLLIERLCENLYHENWKVRVSAFNYLGYEGLLPKGFKPKFTDLLKKWTLGTPKG
ncbi:hypothetical protein ACVWYN_002495 [Pedobacter sp. UYP24]